MKNRASHLAVSTAIVCALAVQGAFHLIQASDSTAGFKEFNDRIQEYAKIHKDADGSVPSLKKTDKPEVIEARQDALAKKIRELRAGARRGDIFTERAQDAFVAAIRNEFKGPLAKHAKETVAQGDPLKGFRIGVNQIYPDALPFTTVPPTLLLNLPRLPAEVAYRILGSDLLLVDTKARIIVDIIPNAIP